MQYQKHNFAVNFLNAIETDHELAWDILVNEVNEIILEYPQDVEKAVRDAGLRLHSNPSPKDLVDVIHEGIYVNEDLRKNILKIISFRQADPHFSATGGEYDKVLVDGVEKKDFNADGDLLNDDNGMLNIMGSKLFSNVKDKLNGALDKQKTKSMMSNNLAAKEKQKNLPVSKSKGAKMSTNKIIGISLAVAAGIGLIAFTIYQVRKNKA